MSRTNRFALNDRISKELSFLQRGYGNALVDGLDDVINLLLDERGNMSCGDKTLLDAVYTINNMRQSLKNLLPEEEKGGEQ